MKTISRNSLGSRLAQNVRAALFWAFVIAALVFSAIQPAHSTEVDPAREPLAQSATHGDINNEYKAEVARLIKMQRLGKPVVSEKFPDLARRMNERALEASETDTLRGLYTGGDLTRRPTLYRHTVTPSEDGMILATVAVIYLLPSLFLLLLLVFSALPQNAGKHSRVSIFYRRLSQPDEIASLARMTGIVVTVGSALRLILLAGGVASMESSLPTIALALPLLTIAALVFGVLTWAGRTHRHAIPLALISTCLLCVDLYIKTTVGQNAGIMLSSLLALYLAARLMLSNSQILVRKVNK